MKHLGKRGLALLLTVCLLFGALPAMPAAAEGDESTVGLTRAALAVEVYRWFLPTASSNDVSFDDIENCTKEQKAAILSLAKAGIIQGNTDGSFSPNEIATRLAAAIAIYRAMGGAESATTQNLFGDIPEEQAAVFNYLVANDVLNEEDATEGKFSPNDPVTADTLTTWLSRVELDWHLTRAAFAVMVCEAFDLTTDKNDVTFTDIENCSDEEKGAILTLANLGIISGTWEGEFDPNGLVNRMAGALVLYRVYKYFGKTGTASRQTVFTDDGMYAENGTSINIIGTAFDFLVSKDILGMADVLFPTEGNNGLFVMNAMANRTTVQGWLNKAAAELNPAQGHTVTVNVTGEGADVASYTVNWYQNGEKLQAEGTNITVTDTSVPLYYEVVLDNDALKQYSMTNGSGAVIFSEGNTTEITVTLTSYQTVSVNGTVQDENEAPIPGATVTITQHYSASVSEPLTSVTTDANGIFTISSANAVPSVLKISAPGYYDLSTAVALDSGVDNTETTVKLEPFQLRELSDSRVKLTVNLQAAAAQGETSGTTALSSFANLEFSVTKGDGTSVTEFAAQFPYLVFDKNAVSERDILTISVRDTSGRSTMKQAAIVTLNSDGSGSGELTLLENGKIAINALTGVDQATVMVFDDGGNLVSSGAAWGAYTSPSLPDGTYTVVALEKTDLIQSVSSLSQLSELGLASNNYVQTTATVSNGVITEIDSLTVPELDESAISYTEFASATVDMATAAAGRNVTLRVEYQLKEQYANAPVSLKIALPDGLKFIGVPTLNGQTVAYSGSNSTTYTISGTSSGIVRVYIQGTVAGSYDISPKLTIGSATQPVGTAHVDITNAEIYVPEITSKKSPIVSGTTTAGGNVTVYVDDTAVRVNGADSYITTADQTGRWEVALSLADTSWAQHQVYATITNGGDSTITTETKTLVYDPDYIDVSKVTMYNVVEDREQAIVFDYNAPDSGSNYFTAGGKEYTFVVEFDDGKDYSRLANVRLNLFTISGDVYTVPAEQMGNTNRFTAVASGVIPVNVGVEYVCLPAKESNSPAGLEYDWATEGFQQIFSDFLEIKRTEEWEDAIALWVGPKEIPSSTEGDPSFLILMHSLDYSDYADKNQDAMKAQGFAQITAEKFSDASGEYEAASGYHRVALTYDAIQHVVVLPPASDDEPKNGVAVAITIPIDYVDIFSGLATEEQKLAALAEAAEATEYDALLASDMPALLSEGEQELAQVIPFPYMDEELSQGAFNWRKISSIVEDRENTGALAYFPAFADLIGLEGQIAGERIKIWEEIEYERERIKQLSKAESCYGLPLLTQAEIDALWQKLTTIVELEESIYEYREAALDLYIKRILVAGLTDLAAGLDERIKGDAEEAVQDSIFNVLRHGAKWWLYKLTGSMQTAGKIVNLFVKGGKFITDVKDKADNVVDGLNMTGELVTEFLEGDPDKIYGNLDGRPYWEETRKVYGDLGKLVEQLDGDINGKIQGALANCPPTPLPNHDEDPAKSPCKDKIYGIDPSGYVYEAVPSNRLADVKAEIFKKEDGSETYTQWSDAGDYGGQSASITTGESGEYRWDVPEGTWKVEFTKNDYSKAERACLTVPPPRTDVNMGMISNSAPTVESVQVYTDGAQVVFSQYMDIDSVQGAITLTVNGKQITCTVKPLDAETDTNMEKEGEHPTYASRFQVTPTHGTLSGSVAVTVSTSAKSYNGQTLGENYETSATSPTKTSPTGIVSSGAVVQLDETGTLTFTLQPGLSGEMLTVESLTPSLVQVDSKNESQTVTTTGDGTASVTVKGLLPGKGRVMITHAASGLSQVVEVNIVTSAGQLGAPAPVTATVNGKTLADGQTVTKGSQVVLSSTERATIRYTLDGTCPKTESALTYGGPISINSDTVLRAVAVTQDGATFGPTARWEIKIAGNDSPSQPSTPSTPTTPDKPKLPFTDLGENQWYESAIEYAYTHDIMEGMSETKFSPNTSLTRAQAVQILYNLEGQPTVTRTTSFADLTTHWAAKPIAWAEQTGVVDGYEDNTFRPENNVTRQEFAQMMYNYAAYKDYDLSAKGDLSQFTDGDSVQEWAVTAMSWANGNALINGHDDGTLEPGGTTTRAQAASILMRFDQNLVEN